MAADDPRPVAAGRAARDRGGRRRVGVARDRRCDPRLDGRARRRPARGRRPRALRRSSSTRCAGPSPRPVAGCRASRRPGRWPKASGPATDAAGGAPTLSPPIDRLIARKLLLGQRWGAEWSRRDGLGFDQAIGRLVATVHELLHAMATKPPAGRAARVGGARTRPAARRTPGARPRRHRRPLGRAGAAAAHRRAVRPSPIGVDRDRGGRPRRAGRLAARAKPSRRASRSSSIRPTARCSTGRHRGPCRPSVPAPASRTRRSRPQPRCWRELSAGRAAGGAGGPRPAAGAPGPRAAGAQRRAGRRRDRLAAVDDARRRRASWPCCSSARHDAGNDALLDWLKSGTRWGRHDRHAIAALEARVRRAGVSRVAGLATVPLHDAAAERLRDDAVAVLRPLQDLGSAPLAEWLAARSRRSVPAAACRCWPTTRRARCCCRRCCSISSPQSALERLAALTRSSAEPGRVHALVRRGPRAGHLPTGPSVSPMRRTTAPMSTSRRSRERCCGPSPRVVLPGCDAAPRRLAHARRPAAARGRRAGRHRLAAASGSGASGSPSRSCCASRR